MMGVDVLTALVREQKSEIDRLKEAVADRTGVTPAAVPKLGKAASKFGAAALALGKEEVEKKKKMKKDDLENTTKALSKGSTGGKSASSAGPRKKP